jgi:3-hydroxyacyl-[acyl-carrier-protein] dehydratase
MSIEAIKSAIPHREPFLLVDEIVEQSETRIVCRKTFSGDEFWYRGHYPDYPITPGVILCEAAMQAGAVLLSKLVADSPDSVPVATRANNVQFKQMVRPGDTIDLEVELTERLANAFFMKARVTVGGKVACRFEFACTLAEKNGTRMNAD